MEPFDVDGRSRPVTKLEVEGRLADVDGSVGGRRRLPCGRRVGQRRQRSVNGICDAVGVGAAFTTFQSSVIRASVASTASQSSRRALSTSPHVPVSIWANSDGFCFGVAVGRNGDRERLDVGAVRGVELAIAGRKRLAGTRSIEVKFRGDDRASTGPNGPLTVTPTLAMVTSSNTMPGIRSGTKTWPT